MSLEPKKPTSSSLRIVLKLSLENYETVDFSLEETVEGEATELEWGSLEKRLTDAITRFGDGKKLHAKGRMAKLFLED